MTARVALSSGNRSAQYVGTTRVGSSGGVSGSSTARLFNGAGASEEELRDAAMAGGEH